MVSRKLAAIRNANVLTILNVHRVCEGGNACQSLKPDCFEELVLFLSRNFQITTFGDLHDDASSKKPKLILSFDDGYKDFINFAVPILDKHGIRVNHNLIPECIEDQLPPLNILAQDFVGTAPAELVRKLRIPGMELGGCLYDKKLLALRLSAFLKKKPIAEQKVLKDQLLPQFLAYDGFRPTQMMTLPEVRQLIGVHELGAHSFSHATMEFETDEYFLEDLARCKSYFKDAIKIPVDIYAFPNGSYRSQHIDLATKLGYRHILLTGHRFSHCSSTVHYRFGFAARSPQEAHFFAVGGLTRPSASVWSLPSPS